MESNDGKYNDGGHAGRKNNSCRAVGAAEQVMYSSLCRGLNFKLTMGNIITLTPPLTITSG